MNNQEIAVKFLNMCAMESPAKAFDQFVNANFIHHNQYFPGDRESLIKAMIEADKAAPNKRFTVKQVFEDNDRVAVHSHVVKETMDIAVVHMLRFENGKISEMWDVGQIVEKNSPNKNGMF